MTDTTNQSNGLNHINQLRMDLLKAISETMQVQRVFFESNGTFELSRESIKSFEVLTTTFTDYTVNLSMSTLWNSSLLGYNDVKLRSVSDLGDIFISLIKPVYTHLIDSGEIILEDMQYTDFIFYVLNHPK